MKVYICPICGTLITPPYLWFWAGRTMYCPDCDHIVLPLATPQSA